MTLKQTFILGLSLTILSCSEIADRSKESITVTTNDKSKIANTTDTEPTTQKQKSEEGYYKLTLQFDNVALLLRATHDYVPKISKLNADTTHLVIEYPGQTSDLQFSVMPKMPFDSIIVEQKFENALTLTNSDERFVHLKKWWHIDTVWQAIQFNRIHRTFKIIPYDHQEREKIFNQLYKEEFKEIKKEALSCKTDNHYGPIIKNATEMEMLPLDIWASKYIIRISIITVDKKIEKHLIIKGTYGC